MRSNEKINAAKKAVEFVEDGMVVGIGSGTTVEFFIEELGRKVISENMDILAVASSYKSHILAAERGITVSDLFQHSKPDIYVDGADQIDSQFNCIKGGGAALTREKILAYASKQFIVIVDSSKMVEKLNMPLPVEILPFAYGFVKRRISEIGGNVMLREGKGKFGPIISDNGNFIADCDFGIIDNPEDIEGELNNIPGVVENGIFRKEIVSRVIMGKKDGAEILKR